MTMSKKKRKKTNDNVLSFAGSILPIREIVVWSHDVGAKVLVDACQSVPHMVVDVQHLDVDFLVASSHKVCCVMCAAVLQSVTIILS